MAIGLLLRPDQHLSHTSAARLWQCPLPRALTSSGAHLHVSTVGDGPVERRTGITGHRIAPDRAGVTAVLGIRTSTPAALWYECRTLLSVRQLVVLGDHMVGSGRLTTVDALERTVHSGDRGVTTARTALERIRTGAESPMESVLRLIVVDAGFPEPALNIDVADARGVFIGRVDMGWADLRIALEYDGDHHRTDRGTFLHDRSRRNAFVVEDWLTIHVTAPDVSRPAEFLERLRQAFELRQHTTPRR
ncbi:MULTISPECIES: hypothetical protein [unclassified Curtobacterium]|uniref:hypothetical protein n=1 Tax=unclassified Curtobacterium TaxID=257496 RepID=UPI00226B9ECD|nr:MULTISPECIES: hypothetical protein [unclassified Curtobacterium]